jgi:class 3 adenylate cyclase
MKAKGVRVIADHRERLRALLPRFNGRLVGEIGDGTLSSFDSVIDAVECARKLQSVLQEDPELRLRIGIHVGDVLFTDNTVLGDGVNVASHIHALAPPGGIAAWLSYAYGASGDRVKARTMIDELNRRSLRGYVTPFNEAIVYLGMGNRERALDDLEKAYAANSQWMAWLKMDHIFDPLRSDPRFIRLLRKVGLDNASSPAATAASRPGL